MARLQIFVVVGLMLAVSCNLVTCSNDEIESDGNVVVVPDMAKYLIKNPGLKVQPLLRDTKVSGIAPSAMLTYRLGKRIAGKSEFEQNNFPNFWQFCIISFRNIWIPIWMPGDRPITNASASQSFSKAQNVKTNLNYPKNGMGAVITYIEIAVTQVKYNKYNVVRSRRKSECDRPMCASWEHKLLCWTCRSILWLSFRLDEEEANIATSRNTSPAPTVILSFAMKQRLLHIIMQTFCSLSVTIQFNFIIHTIFALQSTQLGRAYIVSGGIGQRRISVVIEAQSTLVFNYRATIFGYWVMDIKHSIHTLQLPWVEKILTFFCWHCKIHNN